MNRLNMMADEAERRLLSDGPMTDAEREDLNLRFLLTDAIRRPNGVVGASRVR